MGHKCDITINSLVTLRMYLKDSFIGFEILQYLQQEGLICSFSLLLLLSIVCANCLSFVSSNVLPGVTFVEVYVFPGLRNHKPN